MPALRLRWPAEASPSRLWTLPAGTSRIGPPPSQFGIVIRRLASDSYLVRLIWEDSYLDWRHLRRAEIRQTCIGAILTAIGTRLEDMLEQPIMPRTMPSIPINSPGKAA